MPPQDRQASRCWRKLFFLGAGFADRDQAVVQMALLFGGTWMVNAVVFCTVLAMILIASLFVLRPSAVLAPFYVGLGRRRRKRGDTVQRVPRSRTPAADCRPVSWRSPCVLRDVVLCPSARCRSDRAFGANVAGAMMVGSPSAAHAAR